MTTGATALANWFGKTEPTNCAGAIRLGRRPPLLRVATALPPPRLLLPLRLLLRLPQRLLLPLLLLPALSFLAIPLLALPLLAVPFLALLLLPALLLPFASFADDVPLGKDGKPIAGHSTHGDAFDEGPRQAAVLMRGMGSVSFPITAANAETQKFFDQGVAQLHGFWYYEAERSFRQAAKGRCIFTTTLKKFSSS